MLKNIFFFALSGLLFLSCSNDNEDDAVKANLTLNLLNLKTLGSEYVYEGWIITPSETISTGTFTSISFPQTFSVIAEDLNNASAFVLSIEPANDSDPNPSNTKILKGNFSGNAASLTIDAVIGDFSSATGQFIMATYTDTDLTNDQNGVWFLNPTTTPYSSGLIIPTLGDNSGWKYEGWVVENGIPVSTGTFLNPNEIDDFSPFSGNQSAPNFPGEDFLNSTVAPDGVIFPLDVRGKQVVISIEPSPDNDSSPFFLKPLVGLAGQLTNLELNSLNLNSASFPIGNATR